MDFIAHLDWLERLDALIKLLRWGRSWRFQVPRYGSLSGREIEQMLHRYGVKIWDRNFSKDSLFFRVKFKQARWAEYLLRRARVPVLSHPFQHRKYDVPRY